ncbi:hypothetical protein SAMN04487936_104295 [Halobacillus dabanensis]|uniref:Uncharacterized protein n=1 Tax=Halobacillus dabanensis TaxID=240302 RepID=A0A1I3UI88_HALDA|nr:hypothetical protein SAMN04487936_104295 [Halobacillus dabanensis]
MLVGISMVYTVNNGFKTIIKGGISWDTIMVMIIRIELIRKLYG